jgi:hypothetical protein
MVKQEAFKWTCYKKKEILALVNDYFSIHPCSSGASEKIMRITMIKDFYKLRNLHAHSASANSDLGKAPFGRGASRSGKYFMVKWNSFMDK